MSTPQANQYRLSNYRACRQKYEVTLASLGLVNKKIESVFELIEADNLSVAGRPGRAAARVFIVVGEGLLATIKLGASFQDVDIKPLSAVQPERAMDEYEDHRRINSAEMDVMVDCGMAVIDGAIIALDPTKITILTVGPAFAASLAKCFRSVDIAVNRSKSRFLSSGDWHTASHVIDGIDMVSSAISGIKGVVAATGVFRNGAATWGRAASRTLMGVELTNSALAFVDVARLGTSLVADDLIDILCDEGVSHSSPKATAPTVNQLNILREMSFTSFPQDHLFKPSYTGPTFKPAR